MTTNKSIIAYLGNTDRGVPIYQDWNGRYRTRDGKFCSCALAIAQANKKLYWTSYGWLYTEE